MEKRNSISSKKQTRWNGKRIIQKLYNSGKIQININKVANSDAAKSWEIQRKFRSIVNATKAMYRAPPLLTINLDTPREIENRRTDSKILSNNVLQGQITIKHDIDVNIPSVNAVCCNIDNDIFIGCWNRKPLSQLSISDNAETKQSFETSVSDMCITRSGDILITRLGENSIKKISAQDGSIITFKTFIPLFPEGLHVNRKGEILVTVVDESSFFVDKTTTRKVLKLSEHGRIIQDIEYGDNGLKLFILPYRVTENVNGDICVVNRTGRYLGQIVVLDKIGRFKFTYDGNPNLPCCDFIPMGIACDGNGHIIVTDPTDFSIHILDQNGMLLQYLNSTAIGINPPISVCVDRTGLLWVGSMDNTGKQGNKSKLYALC